MPTHDFECLKCGKVHEVFRHFSDKLPEKIRTSSVLSGNELAILASYEDIPKKDPDFVCNLTSLQTHEEAKKLINMSQVDLAWQYLIHD